MTKSKTNDRLIDHLRSAITDGTHGLSDVPALIKRVIEENLWQTRFIRQSKEIVKFENFSEFVKASPPEGLGTTLAVLLRLCSDEPIILGLLEETRNTNEWGGDRRSKKFRKNKSNNVTLGNTPRGNSKAYSLKRLKKSRPDLYEQVAGGLMTTNRAMIEANFRQKTITVTMDIEKMARTIRKHFNDKEIERLIKRLSGN